MRDLRTLQLLISKLICYVYVNFLYGTDFFLQTHGTAISTHFTSDYTNLFMGWFEYQYVYNNNQFVPIFCTIPATILSPSRKICPVVSFLGLICTNDEDFQTKDHKCYIPQGTFHFDGLVLKPY